MIALSTLAGLAPWMVALSVVIVIVGAATQASIGIGLGLLAAPTLGLIDADFVPGAIILSVVPLTVGMAVRERGHIDRHGIGQAVVGRFLGVVGGALLIANSGKRSIAIVVGISVLFAVVASLFGLRFAPSRRNLFLAGTASGFSGTVAGIGGPPMALTYQHSDPRVLRGTLAAFNVIGAGFSIPSLVIAGVIGRRQLELAAVLIPGVLIGLWSGRYTIARLPPERVRPLVLVACSASALLLLGRQLTG